MAADGLLEQTIPSSGYEFHVVLQKNGNHIPQTRKMVPVGCCPRRAGVLMAATWTAKMAEAKNALILSARGLDESHRGGAMATMSKLFPAPVGLCPFWK